MCRISAKGFLDSNHNYTIIDKISIFHGIAQYLTYSQKSYFQKYNNHWKEKGHPLPPYKFYGRDFYFMLAVVTLKNKMAKNINKMIIK